MCNTLKIKHAVFRAVLSIWLGRLDPRDPAGTRGRLICVIHIYIYILNFSTKKNKLPEGRPGVPKIFGAQPWVNTALTVSNNNFLKQSHGLRIISSVMCFNYSFANFIGVLLVDSFI